MQIGAQQTASANQQRINSEVVENWCHIVVYVDEPIPESQSVGQKHT